MEETKINRLRSMGYGYVKIAQILGLAENTVKSYCRRHPLPSMDGICPQCGGKTDSRRRFCSDACRASWWNAHHEHPGGKKQAQFVCQNCGESFLAYQNPKYCCHACFIAARYGKGRERRG